MSDAQLPPDAGDGESDLPRRPGLRLTEAGVIAAARFEAFADGALKDVRASASDANANGTVMHDAPDAPETAAQREADETSADDQPMLDLGFPDLLIRRHPHRCQAALRPRLRNPPKDPQSRLHPMHRGRRIPVSKRQPCSILLAPASILSRRPRLRLPKRRWRFRPSSAR